MSEIVYRCPICLSPCRHDTDMMDGWALIEEYIDCPNQHYHYSFVHGICEVYLSPQAMWTWDGWESVAEREVRRKEMEIEIEKQKQLWLLIK